MIVRQIGDESDHDVRGLAQMSKRYVCDTDDEVLACGEGDFPSWVKITHRRETPYRNTVKKLVTVYAEGMNPNIESSGGGLSGSGSAREDTTVYEFDVVLEELPIETCPKINELIEKYGGKRADDGSARVTFPLPFLGKADAAGSAFGGGGTKSNSTKNPLYGLTSWLQIGAIFRASYVVRQVSSAIFSQVGTIRRELPFGLPTPEGCSWVVLTPKVRRRGACLEVSEELRMIRDDGGLKIIYELLQTTI